MNKMIDSLHVTSSSVSLRQVDRAVWRWHFYAGLFVIPFLFMLSLSGLLMLISKPVESFFNQHLTTVVPIGTPLPASSLLTKVRTRYPHDTVALYLPPKGVNQSARFSITGSASGHVGHHTPSTTVYLNPYSGEVLGTLDPAKTVYARLQDFHGSLFLGPIGDALIEIAAGFAVLMVVTGLYLAWPGRRWIKSENRRVKGREKWRRWHRVMGLLIAIPLLFFLISGLAWTNVWGGKLVQAWSSLPGTSYTENHAVHTHESMKKTGINPIPWALEKTPLPASKNHNEGNDDLDGLIAFAETQGFDHYRVHLPQHDAGVWTVSATTISGDVINPFNERIVHIDQSDGRVLAEILFADYSVLGKAMAAFIPLHQGDLGVFNWLINIVLVIIVIILIVSGIMTWWKRRPNGAFKLAAPVATPPSRKAMMVFMLILACFFPLSAAALLALTLFDYLLVSRIALLIKNR